jgi:hypothetical protein
VSDQILALLATAGWVLVVAVILGLFGTTSGGAWSLAGSVARGVTEWAGHRRDARVPRIPAGAAAETADTVDL